MGEIFVVIYWLIMDKFITNDDSAVVFPYPSGVVFPYPSMFFDQEVINCGISL